MFPVREQWALAFLALGLQFFICLKSICGMEKIEDGMNICYNRNRTFRRDTHMEFRVLQYFLAVAREENITRAAALLHITQPTLSRQLIQLEEELGARLFHRGKHSIQLTEDGMLLRRRAQEIIDLTEKTKKELKHGEEAVSGEIAIGCGETKNMKPLSGMIASFRQKHPDVSFDIYTAIADDVKERLENGVLDMGLLLEPVEISRYHYLRMPLKEKWHVLMRRDSPLAEKQRITPDDLAEVPLIAAKRQSVRNELENWFGHGRGKLNIVLTCNLSHDNQSVMVESGIGAAVVMELSYSSDTLCLRPLEPEIMSGCVLVWKKNLALSTAMVHFIAHVKECLHGTEA